MVFVAVVLALLGALMIVGFVVLLLKLGALADELRDARTRDAHDMKVQLDEIAATQQGTRLALQTQGQSLAFQLDAIADKQQGTRLDLVRMTSALRTQGQSLASLAFQLEGPPSMRQPILPRSDAQGRETDQSLSNGAMAEINITSEDLHGEWSNATHPTI